MITRTFLSRLLGCTVCASALMCQSVAQSSPKSFLLALSKQDHTLSIVEPGTLRIVAQVPVGDDPHEVVASSDGRTAYVSNYGFGAFHTLAVIDLDWAKADAAGRTGSLARAAWADVRAGEGLVYC